MTAVSLTMSKICVIGMHLDVYKLIWFTLDDMIDTIKLYILMLV